MPRVQIVSLVCLALSVGCGEDDAGATGSGSGTTAADGMTTGERQPSTTGITASGPTDPEPDPTTSTTDDVDGSSSGEDEGTSTGSDLTRGDTGSTSAGEDSTGCVLGTLDCGCDGGACDEGLECSADDLCTPPAACESEDAEPNETEATATDLGDFNDNDSNGESFSGVLDGEDDVDWYRYSGNDVAFQTVDPFRAIEAEAGVRFCKFALCDDGADSTEFPCGDAETVTSPDGAPGCCANSLIHVPDANCQGTIDDDMEVWIRVDQAEAACVPYTVSFHY